MTTHDALNLYALGVLITSVVMFDTDRTRDLIVFSLLWPITLLFVAFHAFKESSRWR